MKKKLILFIATALTLSACDDLFEPAIENNQIVEQMYGDQEYMRGILHTVYSQVPNYYDNGDYATDDAVTNEPGNYFMQMATGAWTNTSYNPLSQWTNSYNAIQYINLYLLHAPNVTWSTNEEQNVLFARRLEGEAYGLRGMFYYYLMRAHAGFGTNGELLGVPLFLEFLEGANANYNLPRASFQECVDQINSDLQRAEELLPLEYDDVTEVPAKFQNVCTDIANYNNVMGSKARGLMNGLIAKAFRAQMALLAASPLYQDASNTTDWETAADAAAEVLDYRGGVSGLDPDGVEYYSAAITNALGDGVNPAEIIWRTNKDGGSNTQESANFPPSLYGIGRMNPSQNLVDAFPMANGYPIDDANSGYNANDPYANRDPRLDKYILHNGSVISEKGVTINITNGNADGINTTESRSTRTGYYMKKRMRWDVNLDPGASTNQPHYTPRIRYTEMYLNYAEAANEAWGPKGTGSHGYSAYDVIKAIRQRAGIGGTDDPYLEACANSQDKMRELIRNERRLELCFDGFRFWDVRRWKLDLNEPVYGLQWNGENYERFLVEERSYEDYMYFSPIPNSEILKYDQLIQNKGWE